MLRMQLERLNVLMLLLRNTFITNENIFTQKVRIRMYTEK